MEYPTNQSAPIRRPDTSQGLPDSQRYWLNLSFQLSLAGFLLTFGWQQFGPVLQTAIESRLQLFLVGSGFSIAAGLWIADSRWSWRTKVTGTIACVLVAFVGGIKSAREFDVDSQVLDGGKIRQGRVVHRGLGLSYAILPDFRANLRPIISHGPDANSTPLLPRRLKFGEAAILCRMVQSQEFQGTRSKFAPVVISVQPYRVTDASMFIRGIRKYEATCAESPNVRILQHTHSSKVAGLDMVEFEFVTQPENRLSRQAFLMVGRYLMNINMNIERPEDRRLLDEFLNSIRYE